TARAPGVNSSASAPKASAATAQKPIQIGQSPGATTAGRAAARKPPEAQRTPHRVGRSEAPVSWVAWKLCGESSAWGSALAAPPATVKSSPRGIQTALIGVPAPVAESG